MRPVLILSLAMLLPAHGVIFHGTADASHNRETAPAGPLAGSGWQFLGEFGDYLGTMIGPQHFLTAAHVPSSPTTFVSKDHFSGAGEVVYTIDTGANGGTGFWTIPDTDLRVYKINETFPGFARLYGTYDEVGKDLVVMGRGTQRGDLVQLDGNDLGWKWGAVDRKSRWGTNAVESIVSGETADYLYGTFDAAEGGDECHLSTGDSGGPVFVKTGGVWKVAGVNYAVDGSWDFNDVTDNDEFRAALFDARGMYVGTDASGWTLVEDEGEPVPSGFYASRVSDSVSEIATITGVPVAVIRATHSEVGLGHVNLDASHSPIPDAVGATYSWTWPGGSSMAVSPSAVLPVGPGTVTLTVTDGSLVQSTAVLELNITTLAGETAAAGLAGPDADADATPFDDGVENLLKYAFNMDLSGPDSSTMAPGGSSGLPNGRLVEVEGQTYWRVEYVERIGSGLSYQAKKSTTLAPLSFVNMAGSETVTPLNGEWQRVVIDEMVTPGVDLKLFTVVEVTEP